MKVELRPLEPEDAPELISLLSAALPTESITPAKFASYVLDDPNRRAGGAIVATAGGRIAGFIYAAVRNRPLNEQDARRGYITILAAAPDLRRRGIGAQLLHSAERFLIESGKTEVLISPYAPRYFTPGVDIAYPAAIGLFEKYGYRPISRPISMRCDLRTLTEPAFVDQARKRLIAEGVRFAPVTEALGDATVDFAMHEFGADWAEVYRSAIEQVRAGHASPSRLIVAHQDGRILGASHHDADRFGPIGVANSARHRRIGQVLMYETLKAQHAASLESAYFLWSDDATADRLYRGAGFVEARRFVILRKQFA